MIKDRKQKAEALAYISSKGWFPQLEVVITPSASTSNTNKSITDLDVLALIPDDFIGYRKLIIDCKTRKNESPINRALWLRGLMDRYNAENGICILNKNIERDHRLAATDLNVLLLHEADFPQFIRSSSGFFSNTDSFIADITNWDKYLDIAQRNKALAPAISFSTSEYWMCKTPTEAVRKSIATVRQIKGELDPRKNEHVSIVCDLASLFMVALNSVVVKIFTSFFQPEQRDDLEAPLLMLLYGGRETYRLLNHYRKMIKIGDDPVNEDLALPQWEKFIQLTRQMLDSPCEAQYSPLLLRELSLGYLTDHPISPYAQKLASRYPHAAKFALLGAEYLCKSSGLQREFGESISNNLLSLSVKQPPLSAK